MTLTPGFRLGPYEIVAPAGAGGMGEVYRATDTRLNRTVAVKVIPERLKNRPDYHERFEREARAVSRLSHPHICSLYDVGKHSGIDFLVMEYLAGQTLADRLVKGPLPHDLVLQYAIEIADALDHAHRQGIVHRDLKPSNIMLTKPGTKLLDFGLAKLRAPALQFPPETATLNRAPITAEGTLLGTFQYMAPEQIEGRETDARTDLFALGTVVYEMATGRKAFDGKSPASVMAAVLERDPPVISSSQPLAPPALDRVVQRCLAKDPDERWQTARDLAQELRWIASSASRESGIAPRTGGSSRSRDVVVGSVVAAIATIAMLTVPYLRSRPAEEPPVRLPFLLPPDVKYVGLELGGPLSISPDGRRLAFVAVAQGGKPSLWVRHLDSLSAENLQGTEGASYPFWSPDSQFIAFFSQGRLKRIGAAGGTAQTIGNATLPRGGTWNRAGVILFVADGGQQIYSITPGGQPVPLTVDGPNNESFWPQFLPDDRHFIYVGRPEKPGIYVASLDSKETSRLSADYMAASYASGYLLLLTGSGAAGNDVGTTLVAQPFDATGLTLTGEPLPLAEQVAVRSLWALGGFSVSENGRLVYERSQIPTNQLKWFDRGGQQLESVGGSAGYDGPALSPDGKVIAVEHVEPREQTRDIWLMETTRGISSRLTFDPALDIYALWDPDGSRIVFSSARDGNAPNLYQRASSGADRDERLTTSTLIQQPTDWSSDGKLIVYATLDPKTQWDIWVLPAMPAPSTGARKAVPFLQTEFNEHNGQLSPDGRWMAYVSDESGTWDVYVRAFSATGTGARWKVSTNGGVWPRWRRDGKELFYIAADGTLNTVAVKPGAGFDAGSPQPLFRTSIAGFRWPLGRIGKVNYVPAGDGQRFLITTVSEETVSSPFTILLNWPAVLPQQRAN